MLKNVLAVVTGFVVWSVGWLSYNAVLQKIGLLPADQTQPIQSVAALLLLLFGSVFLSLATGYITALIGQTASKSSILVLGFLLLAVGIFFQTQFWHLMPLWYHLCFLALLIPFCLIGASLRRVAAT
jgi:hypothetical protein